MKCSTLKILSVALTLAWSSVAWAVDGVIEINQHRALAGGVTAGDTAGFPVTLSQRGSYRLTGISPAEIEAQDFADGSPRGNHINRMVDASEIGFLTAYLASDKSWAVTGEVIMAGGGSGNSVYY